jgi:hypothetical protein
LFCIGEFGLKIEAAHARPPDVEHQTPRGSGSLPAKNSVSEPHLGLPATSAWSRIEAC